MLQSGKVERPIHSFEIKDNYKATSKYFDKGLQFLFQDRRKVVSLILVISLPILTNIWRFVPETIEVDWYPNLSILIWTFFVNLASVIVAVAWYFTIPRKDFVLQIIASAVIYYGLFMVFTMLPFTENTSIWSELLATLVLFFFFYLCIRHIRNNYLDRPMDYKMLHDGLVHDLHHQRFMGSINRIEGLIHVAKMEEPYKDLCEKELEELKNSVAYIADKYNGLY